MHSLFKRNRHRQQAAEWAAEAVKQLYPFLKISLPFASLAKASAQMNHTVTTLEPEESDASLTGELVGAGIGLLLFTVLVWAGWKYFSEHNKKHKALHDGHIQISDECSKDSCNEQTSIATGYSSSARPSYV